MKLRVISFPSIELFENQDENYKKEIIGEKPLFAVEAGVINGWEKYINYKNFIGMNSFGASAPANELFKFFGFDPYDIKEKILKKIS